MCDYAETIRELRAELAEHDESFRILRDALAKSRELLEAEQAAHAETDAELVHAMLELDSERTAHAETERRLERAEFLRDQAHAKCEQVRGWWLESDRELADVREQLIRTTEALLDGAGDVLKADRWWRAAKRALALMIDKKNYYRDVANDICDRIGVI